MLFGHMPRKNPGKALALELKQEGRLCAAFPATRHKMPLRPCLNGRTGFWCCSGDLFQPWRHFIPKYVTFDCYGTLTRFQMADMARTLFSDAIPPAGMEQFVADFAAYRLDEVLGDWKPYLDVIVNAVERTTRR